MKRNLFIEKRNKKLFFIIPFLICIFSLLCFSSDAQQLKYGALSINSNPKGAKVYLNNDYKGETPLDLKNITTGQYNLKMTLDGYQDWTTTVVVLPILTVRITADLVPKVEEGHGSISVNSNPQGARVYLDNAYKGNTPLNIRDVAVGRHTIRILISGYEEWISDIAVYSSRVERISVDLKPQKEYGSITINSNPQGADIYIDEEYVGLTPLDLQNISAGKYTIKISFPGYEEWINEVSILPSRTERVYAELESRPDYGSISIYCSQKNAKVFLNGTYKIDIIEIPTILEDIESGNYEIVIIKDGFRAWIGDIKVFVDEVTSVDVTMAAIFK